MTAFTVVEPTSTPSRRTFEAVCTIYTPSGETSGKAGHNAWQTQRQSCQSAPVQLFIQSYFSTFFVQKACIFFVKNLSFSFTYLPKVPRIYVAAFRQNAAFVNKSRKFFVRMELPVVSAHKKAGLCGASTESRPTPSRRFPMALHNQFTALPGSGAAKPPPESGRPVPPPGR